MGHHEKIKKDMTIAEVLRKKPNSAAIFMRYGMHCLGCASATGETVEQAAMAHGINLENLLNEMNEA